MLSLAACPLAQLSSMEYVVGIRRDEVAWFCGVHAGFGVFTLCITCDFQINALCSLLKISAEITDKTSSFRPS